MSDLFPIVFVMVVAAAFYNLGRWHEKKATTPSIRALEKHAQALADDVANAQREVGIASRCTLLFARDMREHIERTVH